MDTTTTTYSFTAEIEQGHPGWQRGTTRSSHQVTTDVAAEISAVLAADLSAEDRGAYLEWLCAQHHRTCCGEYGATVSLHADGSPHALASVRGPSVQGGRGFLAADSVRGAEVARSARLGMLA